MPALTVQAYLDKRGGTLQYACLVRTWDLFTQATDDMLGAAWESQTNRSDGNEFAVFWTDWLEGLGIKVMEFCADGVEPVRPDAYGNLSHKLALRHLSNSRKDGDCAA